MKTLLPIFFCISLLILSVSAQEDAIAWEKNFGKAQKIARQTGRPLLLDFTASWCKPCLAMDKEFWVRPDVIEAAKPFIAVKLNYDNERSLASRYGATAIPFVVFTDPLGNMVTFRRGFGSKNAREITQIFDEMPKDFSILLPFYEAIEKNKNDSNALLRIADSYHNAKMTRLSCDFYKRALKTDEVKNDAEKLEQVLATIGINYYSIKDYNAAADYFEDYIKLLPTGKNRAVVMTALTISQAYLGKFKDAEKMLTQLKTEFPGSNSVVHAEREIENAKAKSKN